jgi:hypothetical protein
MQLADRISALEKEGTEGLQVFPLLFLFNGRWWCWFEKEGTEGLQVFFVGGVVFFGIVFECFIFVVCCG